MFKLIIQNPPGPDLEYYLNRDAVDLGRGAFNDLSWADPALSRRHAQISRDGADWVLQDLGSKNGTWVEDRQVSKLVLKDGMEVRLGAVRFRVRDASEPAEDDTRELAPGLFRAAPAEAHPPAAPAVKSVLPPAVAAAASARLYVIKDRDRAEEFLIGQDPMAIGAAKDNQVRLKESGLPSHALRIERREKEFWLAPATEAEGKLPEKFSAPRALRPAEVLKLGNQPLLFLAESGVWNAQTEFPESPPKSFLAENRRLVVLAAAVVLVFIVLALIISLKKPQPKSETAADDNQVAAGLTDDTQPPAPALAVPEVQAGTSVAAEVEPKTADSETASAGIETPVEAEETKVAKAAAKPAAPPPPPPPSPPAPPKTPTGEKLPAPVASADRIYQTAMTLYQQGTIDQAIAKLDWYCAELAKTGGRGCPYKTDIINLNSINKYYGQGVAAVKNNNLNSAEKAFRMVLQLGQNLKSAQPAFYQKEASKNLVQIYCQNGQSAFTRQDYPDAYRNWSEALRLQPDSPAAQEGMRDLISVAEGIYDEAYRLKNINLEQAKEKWNYILTIVPPSSEVYKKTQSNLGK